MDLHNTNACLNISACYHAAEMVLVLHVLTIFSFLLALQMEHAGTLPITVGRMVGATLIVRRTAVEKIRGPFTFRGGGLPQMFQLSPAALPRVRVGLRGPPQGLFSAGTCPCGSHSPSPTPHLKPRQRDELSAIQHWQCLSPKMALSIANLLNTGYLTTPAVGILTFFMEDPEACGQIIQLYIKLQILHIADFLVKSAQIWQFAPATVVKWLQWHAVHLILNPAPPN